MQQTKGTIDTIFEEIRLAEYGVHYLVIYPDMITLRRIYSYYAKMQLEDNNEIVLILPYYETTEMVRNVLSGEDKYNQGSTIDVKNMRKKDLL
jgi:hypothetical protein